MALEQEISKGIMEAMKAKDTVRLTTLRNVKKYIIEAKTASAGITELSDAEVLKIIAKAAKQRPSRLRYMRNRTVPIWLPKSRLKSPCCRRSCPNR